MVNSLWTEALDIYKQLKTSNKSVIYISASKGDHQIKRNYITHTHTKTYNMGNKNLSCLIQKILKFFWAKRLTVKWMTEEEEGGG